MPQVAALVRGTLSRQHHISFSRGFRYWNTMCSEEKAKRIVTRNKVMFLGGSFALVVLTGNSVITKSPFKAPHAPRRGFPPKDDIIECRSQLGRTWKRFDNCRYVVNSIETRMKANNSLSTLKVRLRVFVCGLHARTKALSMYKEFSMHGPKERREVRCIKTSTVCM